MNLLSALLPGLRDFRTPFIVGSLWLGIVGLVVSALIGDSIANYSIFPVVARLLSILPEGAILAILGFVAYLGGSIVSAWTNSRSDGMSPYGRQYLSTMQRLLGGRASALRRANLRNLVETAVNAQMSHVSVSVRQVGEELIFREFQLIGLQLSVNHPERYQEYDRLKAEADLRNAVWLPVAVLSIVIAFLLPLVEGIIFAVAGVVGAVVLANDGVKRRIDSNVYLAQSMYFGLAQPPAFQGLIAALGEIEHGSSEQGGDKTLEKVLEFFASRDMRDLYNITAARLYDRNGLTEMSSEDVSSLRETESRIRYRYGLLSDDEYRELYARLPVDERERLAEMRKMFPAENLGFQNSDVTRR